MFEGIKYKRGKNRPYLIPEIHLLSVWAEIIDNRQERIKLTSRLDEIYARRKQAIDEISPDILLIEYPTDKQDAADSYNEGKINAKELMDRLARTQKGEFEHKAEYEAHEKAMEKVREKESETFKGRKIYCYGWKGNRQEYAKKIDLLTQRARDIMDLGSIAAIGSMFAGKKDSRTTAERYIKDHEETAKTTKKIEEQMTKNIQKIMLKEKNKKTAVICGAAHFIELHARLGAKTTNKTDGLYRVCLEFNPSKKLREQAYDRALALRR